MHFYTLYIHAKIILVAFSRYIHVEPHTEAVAKSFDAAYYNVQSRTVAVNKVRPELSAEFIFEC